MRLRHTFLFSKFTSTSRFPTWKIRRHYCLLVYRNFLQREITQEHNGIVGLRNLPHCFLFSIIILSVFLSENLPEYLMLISGKQNSSVFKFNRCLQSWYEDSSSGNILTSLFPHKLIGSHNVLAHVVLVMGRLVLS